MDRQGSFFQQYWPAFIWLALVLYTFLVAALVAVTHDGSVAVLLAISWLAAAVRVFKNGGKLEQHKEGFVMTIVGNLFSLTVAAVVWPFFELIRQVNFLLRARHQWQNGKIFLDDKGRPLRAG